MNILADEQYRVLGFVAACNRSSYNPTAQQVMLWRENTEPTKAEYRTVQRRTLTGAPPGLAQLGLFEQVSSISRMVETMYANQFRPLAATWASIINQTHSDTKRELVKPAETAIEHLVRLTWLEEVAGAGEDPGLRLTELGRVLLRDREQETVQVDVSVVVLEAKDPLAYPILVGQLANAGAGLLADPYLKLDNLHRIVVSTQLTRLLVLGKPHNNAEVSAMQTYLDSASLTRPVEVRKSIELHDRVLVAEDGTVFTLGTSLNSVGKTTTIMTPTPSPGREALRELFERLWSEAELVGPQPIENHEDADAADNGGQQNELTNDYEPNEAGADVQDGEVQDGEVQDGDDQHGDRSETPGSADS